MKINTRSLTLAATLAALCAVTGFIPYVFFLPVCVAATTLSLGMVAFVGLAFGCISLAYSFVMAASPVSMAFIEAPYIAILPRILAAVAMFGVYKLLMRVFKPTKRGGRFAVTAVAAGLGSLFNTAFVVGLMAAVMPYSDFGGITIIAYVPTMLISGAIECPCMAILVPPITLTLEKTVLRGRKKTDVAVTNDDKPYTTDAVQSASPASDASGDK